MAHVSQQALVIIKHSKFAITGLEERVHAVHSRPGRVPAPSSTIGKSQFGERS